MRSESRKLPLDTGREALSQPEEASLHQGPSGAGDRTLLRATDSLRPPARRGCRPLLGLGTLEPREDTVWSQAQGPGTERMGSCDERWETPGPVRH